MLDSIKFQQIQELPKHLFSDYIYVNWFTKILVKH
jgi:hypothetical protein